MATDVAAGLGTVLALLLQDRALATVDAGTLPWDRPMFVLRSAHMERMQQFLDVVRAHSAAPRLHVMSHARDEEVLRSMAGHDMTFYPYPTPGRYSLDIVPAEMLERLRAVGFGALIFLDAGQHGEGLDAAVEVLAAIDEPRMASFRSDGTFGRPDDWGVHRLASAAYYRLIEWYHAKLGPDIA
jgi:hypothetical protein